MLKIFNIHHLFFLWILELDINHVEFCKKLMWSTNNEAIIKRKIMHDSLYRYEWKYEFVISFKI
jgi:hypothetical protein